MQKSHQDFDRDELGHLAGGELLTEPCPARFEIAIAATPQVRPNVEFLAGEAHEHPAIREAVAAIRLEDSPSYVEQMNRYDAARDHLEHEQGMIGALLMYARLASIVPNLVAAIRHKDWQWAAALVERHAKTLADLEQIERHAVHGSSLVGLCRWYRASRGLPPAISKAELGLV